MACVHLIALRYYHTTAGYNVSLGMEACISAGTCTQEDALKAVQADFVARKIPIRYMRASLRFWFPLFRFFFAWERGRS